MYTTVRKIHLFAGLILFLFILLYAVSGYVLEFPTAGILKTGPSTTRRLAFDAPAGMDAPALADYLKEKFDLHGQLKSAKINHRTGQRDWDFIGPKAFYHVTLSKRAGELAITTQPLGFFQALIRFHHLEGFDGGPIYVVWGVLFDLVCVAMILFAFSGVYLWYKLTKRRALGWIVLSTSVAYTLGTAIYCLCAK